MAADGTAKPLSASRLRNFEGADEDDDLGALLARTPTRAANTTPSEELPPQPADVVAEPPAPIAPRRAAGRPPRADRNLMRGSNVQVPVQLIPLIKKAREDTGRSNGDIIIDAIESAHDRLGELCGGRAATGGGLFSARASRGVRRLDGPLTALNVRLLDADYAVIDSLVDKHAAFSRGHLITVALIDYFAR